MTVCAHERRCTLANPRTNDLRISRLGWLIVEQWMAIPGHHPHVVNDAFVLMPNHLHGILLIDGDPPEVTGRRMALPPDPRARAMKFGAPVAGSLPTIIRSFKAGVTVRARERFRRPELVVWQRGYFERVVRSEDELHKLRRYIADNPRRWRVERGVGDGGAPLEMTERESDGVGRERGGA